MHWNQTTSIRTEANSFASEQSYLFAQISSGK